MVCIFRHRIQVVDRALGYPKRGGQRRLFKNMSVFKESTHFCSVVLGLSDPCHWRDICTLTFSIRLRLMEEDGSPDRHIVSLALLLPVIPVWEAAFLYLLHRKPREIFF